MLLLQFLEQGPINSDRILLLVIIKSILRWTLFSGCLPWYIEQDTVGCSSLDTKFSPLKIKQSRMIGKVQWCRMCLFVHPILHLSDFFFLTTVIVSWSMKNLMNHRGTFEEAMKIIEKWSFFHSFFFFHFPLHENFGVSLFSMFLFNILRKPLFYS